MKSEHMGEPEAEIIDFDEMVASAPLTFPPPKSRPRWGAYDEAVTFNGKRYRPGLYWHSMSEETSKSPSVPIDTWISGPVHLEALTRNSEGQDFGVLLRFLDREGNSRLWAMPYELLCGTGEEARRELLSMGLAIEPRQRAEFGRYLQHRTPKKRMLCTSRTGWTGSGAFVLPDGVVGPDAGGVVFQDGGRIGKGHGVAGTVESWRNSVSRLAIGNPLMTFGISMAFAAPTMELTHAEGGGVNFVGGSSSGKTTILEGARSTFGGPDFKRSWRATSNGVEGVAEQHNDLILCMDEMSEVEPREAGQIAYMLTNGVGKSRATRTGASRPPKRWRTLVFSTGEQSLEATMQAGRLAPKAGQSVRLLDLRADSRRHGCFDELHGHGSGRALSDAIKRAAKENYGAVGRAFLERLTRDERDFGELLEITKSIPAFAGHSGQEGRAAARFALIGMAGELASEYELTGWPENAAINAAAEAFRAWLAFRGTGDQEPRKIREAVRDFLDRHGESRFIEDGAKTDARFDSDERHTRDRAGYRHDDIRGKGPTERLVKIYYFNSAAMKEATAGFELSTVIEVLKECGALEPPGNGKAQQQRKFGGINGKWYVISRERLED
jgi:putative DNA primase/helicase